MICRLKEAAQQVVEHPDESFSIYFGFFFSIIAWVADNITVVNENTYNILFIIAMLATILSVLSWRYLSKKKGVLWVFSFLYLLNGVDIFIDIYFRLF